MASADTAVKIIDSISSQIDLLTTLSVGICAGIVALYIQIALHNRGNDNSKLILKWQFLLILCFFLEGSSILLGYLAYGAITDAIPIIFPLQFVQDKIFSEYEFTNSCMIRALAIFQFLFFLGGILCVFCCLVKNQGFLKADTR